MSKTRLISFVLIGAAVFLMLLKFFFWDYTFQKFLPKKKYEVGINLSFEGYNEAVNIATYLPLSDHRQTITEEINNSPGMNFHIERDASGKKAKWSSNALQGKNLLSYNFSFIGQALQYKIDSNLRIPDSYPPIMNQHLKATEHIQANHPYIHKIYLEEIGKDEKSLLGIVKKIHAYTHSLTPRPFKGVTDAMTAAKLGEASCNGKSRLFVALARTAKIPSRLVGGLILENGSKRTSHQWVEVFINGKWVPFDPLNNHFAFLPHNYLTLYYGDEYLFKHTSNINFDYHFNIKTRLTPNPALVSELKAHPFNAYKLWQAFETIGVPIGLLTIVLLLPLGALIVAVFRNVIGIKTFGVFLPALIAVASRETGLMWGMVAFMIVILTVSLIHFPLEKWGVLYTPKLVVMLVCVVILFMVVSYIAIELNVTSLAYITLFPIVVLTISAERFARTIIESGYKDALILSGQTLVVAAVAYLAMNSRSMEAFFLAFPELFLMIIGFNIILGKWIGLRVSEFARFKWIIK